MHQVPKAEQQQFFVYSKSDALDIPYVRISSACCLRHSIAVLRAQRPSANLACVELVQLAILVCDSSLAWSFNPTLTSIAPGGLVGLPRLQYLDLRSNAITGVIDWSGLTALT